MRSDDQPTAQASDANDGAQDNGAKPTFDTATVEQRDLARIVELDGTVGRGDPLPLALAAQGTITGLPAVGSVIAPGQTLAEIDGEPVVALQGDRPAWRGLEPGISKGEDIRQLESALVALGYADPAKVTVDDTWSSATTAAVKAMQEALGMPKDGRLALGEIVFISAPVRIDGVDGALGQDASAAGITVTGEQQIVTAELDAEDSDLLAVGDSVEITLPSGERIAATVQSIGTPEVADDGSVTLPVVLHAEGLGALDGLPITIEVSVVEAAGVLAVPAEALLALAEGGYAVEVSDSASSTGTRLVAVEVGVFADGWVQISGDIAAGDLVVVA